MRLFAKLFFFSFFWFPTFAQFGSIQVTTNIDRFYLVVNNDYLNASIHQKNDIITIESGLQNIRIIWDHIDDYEANILIQPNQTFEIRPILDFNENPKNSSFTVIENQKNLAIYTDINSTIFLDGLNYGKGHFSGMINPGMYTMIIENEKFGSLRKTINVKGTKITEEFRFNESKRNSAKYFRFVPGASYYINGQRAYATITWIGLALTTINAVNFNKIYNREVDDYNFYLNQYRNATTQGEINRFRTLAENSINDIDRTKKNRNSYIISTGLIYAFSTYHSFRKPKMGFSVRNSEKTRLRLKYDNSIVLAAPTVSLKHSF